MSVRGVVARAAARAVTGALALAVTVAALPRPAAAETWWTAEEEDEEYIPRLRIAPHIGVWAGEFDRTQRGCDESEFFFGEPSFDVEPGAAVVAPDGPGLPPGTPACPTEGSEEVALSAGVSAVYRVLGPLHLSVGLDLALTFPQREYLVGQFIVAVPISVGITHDVWTVRPILNATLTPYFSAPDLRRGFTWGGEWGLAIRVPGLAELQLLGGYHASSDWTMGIIRVAGYLP